MELYFLKMGPPEGERSLVCDINEGIYDDKVTM